MWIRILIALVFMALVSFITLRLLVPGLSPRPGNLGVTNGQLAPCPNTTNCVSTLSTDDEHGITPIPYGVEADTARDALLDAMETMTGGTIITVEPTYIYAEFRTPVMGYIDDVEFLLDEEAGLIHFRSAARLGRSDLGVNRQRMEEIRGKVAAVVAG